LWAGRAKGAAGVFIDERADERQAGVLPLIFGGRAGGFLGFVATLFPEGREFRGAERARITYRVAQHPEQGRIGLDIDIVGFSVNGQCNRV